MPEEAPPHVEVIEPIRRNIPLLAIRIVLVMFIADTVYAALLLATVLGYIPSEWTASYTVLLWVAHTVKNIILSYLVIRLVIAWISTLYFVTEGHLVRQRGVLHTVETVFPLDATQSVVMSQNTLGRLFNFGDVTITFIIARQREEVTLYAVNNPQRYEKLFSTFV
jgi:membrane protein YdbS with pleckstrin-like domain